MDGGGFMEQMRSRKSTPEQSRAALQRLRAMTERADERVRATVVRAERPLHPVSAEVIRSCLTMIELCWAVRSDESRDDIVDRMKRAADIMRAQAETLRSTDAQHTR
jgi:hypothetical protein